MLKAKVNENKEYSIDFKKGKPFINDDEIVLEVINKSEKSIRIIYNNKVYSAHFINVNQEEKVFEIKVNNNIYKVALSDKYDLLLEELGMDKLVSAKVNDIKAPMPGLVLDINVNPGDNIAKGDHILVLEAMKMENIIKSPGEGIIKNIITEIGASVEKNEILIELE